MSESSITPKPAPIDVAAMRAGDIVTIWGTIERVDSPAGDWPLFVRVSGDTPHWCAMSDIAMHIPRPKTFEQFESMSIEIRQSVWDDMNKRCGGGKGK